MKKIFLDKVECFKTKISGDPEIKHFSICMSVNLQYKLMQEDKMISWSNCKVNALVEYCSSDDA